MRVIGLTGGIASGKSTVAQILQNLGVTVVDADELAHLVLRPGEEAMEEVRASFPEAFDRSGELDRTELARIVFEDEERREILNAIVHPRVRALMRRAVAEAMRRGEKAIVLDVPLLIEGGLYREVDEVWLVAVDGQTQIARLMERNGLGREEALLRIRAQMPLERKREFADVVIENEASLEDLRQKVRRLWSEALGRSNS